MKRLAILFTFSLFTFNSFTQIDTCNVAGFDGVIQVCPNEAFDLFTGLSGPFNTNGDWYDPAKNLVSNQQPGLAIPGLYSFCYFNQHPGCPQDTSQVVVEVLPIGACNLGINESEIARVSIYPNPAKEVITIEKIGQSTDLSYQIYNIDGSLMKESTLQKDSLTKVSIATFEPGAYYIRIWNNDLSRVYKFLKE